MSVTYLEFGGETVSLAERDIEVGDLKRQLDKVEAEHVAATGAKIEEACRANAAENERDDLKQRLDVQTYINNMDWNEVRGLLARLWTAVERADRLECELTGLRGAVTKVSHLGWRNSYFQIITGDLNSPDNLKDHTPAACISYGGACLFSTTNEPREQA